MRSQCSPVVHSAELGDPARFRSAAAIASYFGIAPRLRRSGKKRLSGSPTIPFGSARLRKALDDGP
jgi:transposase